MNVSDFYIIKMREEYLFSSHVLHSNFNQNINLDNNPDIIITFLLTIKNDVTCEIIKYETINIGIHPYNCYFERIDMLFHEFLS